jgi:hypothetical protein
MHVREWLLDAGLDELRSPPEEIAAHLRECEACKEVQRDIVIGYGRLDVGLTKLTRKRRKKMPWMLVPLAAAAALTLMVSGRDETVPRTNTMLARLMFPDPAVVVPAEGQQAIVIDRNDMTVVWLTSNRGQQ